MKVKVYQLDHTNKNLFREFEEIKDFKISDYQCVYETEYLPIKSAEVSATPEELLEHFYYIFNVNQPKDYCGHSLSVSDIIQIDDGYYFCENIGWKVITELCVDN